MDEIGSPSKADGHHHHRNGSGHDHRHHSHQSRRRANSAPWLRQLLFLAVYTSAILIVFDMNYRSSSDEPDALSFRLGEGRAARLGRRNQSSMRHDAPGFVVPIRPDSERSLIRSAAGTGTESSREESGRDLRYHELPDPRFNGRDHDLPMRTSHAYSTVIDKAPWFDPKEMCQSTCCAKRVAVSIDHETHRIKNTIDGLDLADVVISGHRVPGHLEVRPALLTDDIVPCLQDGTIIHIDSYGHTVIKFFEFMRPNITDKNVRYVLMTTETDGPQPMGKYRRKLTEDAQLLKWYGNNPNLLVSKPPPTDVELDKFVAFPLGLSKYHPQMPHLQYYLHARNYTNPFADKTRWTESGSLFDPKNEETTDVLFVKFGINARSQHRRIPFDMACNGRTRNATDDITCTKDGHFTMHETYSAASKYLFGLSPRGNGEDCYRSYELFMLGVIPVIVDNYGFTRKGGMWEDLPAVVLDDWNLSQGQLLAKLQNYVRSEKFLSTDFQRGWERLFLGYWRRRILRDAGREDDILLDPDSGRTYYMAWQYSGMTQGNR